MKTIKTLSTLFTAIILLIATEMASAQTSTTSASSDVTVSANVVSTLSIASVTSDLDFGLVGQNIGGNGDTANNPRIDPVTGTATNVLVEGDVSIAKYTLTGTDGGTVEFEYNNLELTSGSKVLNLLPEISTADGTPTGNFGGETLPANDQVTFNGTDMTLWVGGTLEEATTAEAMEAGSYTGDLTITVDYVE